MLVGSGIVPVRDSLVRLVSEPEPEQARTSWCLSLPEPLKDSKKPCIGENFSRNAVPVLTVSKWSPKLKKKHVAHTSPGRVAQKKSAIPPWYYLRDQLMQKVF